jgi:2-hydroxy-6-oxonona-2,4-dienedioate hydrolase
VRPQQVLDRLLKKAHSHTSHADGVALSWQHWPGPAGARPLVLLHGGFGSWTHWFANIAVLQKHRSVWTVDLPGLGASTDASEPHTVEHFASIVLQGLNEFIAVESEFDLAGFSFGALIGSHLAAAAGDRCANFIVCGAAGFGQLHVQVDLLRPPSRETSESEARRITAANLRTLMFARDSSVDDLSVYIHGDNLARSRFNSRRLARGDDFLAALPKISARLCGIWGSEDATAGGAEGIAQRELLFRRAQPGACFHVLPGVGHWAMYEDAERFNRIVENQLLR